MPQTFEANKKHLVLDIKIHATLTKYYILTKVRPWSAYQIILRGKYQPKFFNDKGSSTDVTANAKESEVIKKVHGFWVIQLKN